MADDHPQPRDTNELLAIFMGALADGSLTLSDLTPRPELSPDLIASGWKNAVAILQMRAGDQELVRSLAILQAADPDFESAEFLLGMASFQAGHLNAAREHFRRQLDHPSDLHRRETQGMLRRLRAPEVQ